MTLFDWLNQITVEKREWSSFTEDEQSTFNSYMITRFLSMNKDYITITELIAMYPMPPNKTYDFYKSALPKKKIWNKYIKSNITYNTDELNILAQYFKCSIREIKENINILDPQIKDIILLEIKGIKDKPKKKKKNDKK
jgi:hypothetical protein